MPPSTMVLDGAMGTELLRRGIPVPLPLWSAYALEMNPEMVYQIHKEYVEAGVDIITTNTFRTTSRTYMKTGLTLKEAGEKARQQTKKAIEIARRAVASSPIKIAGSVAPLEDCYEPSLFAGYEIAIKEYREISSTLLENGVDILLMETMGCLSEARAALYATKDSKTPRWVSFILRNNRELLGGGSLFEALKMIEGEGAEAVLINCTDIYTSIKAIDFLLSKTSLQVGLYPNFGQSFPTKEGAISEFLRDSEFLKLIKQVISPSLGIVGTCCGSTHRHSRMLRKLIDGDELIEYKTI